MDHSRQLSPEDVLDPIRFQQYENSVRRSRLVERVLAVIDRPGLEVCDIGGATGVFLDEIARRASQPVRGVVLEVTDAYRSRLVNPALGYLNASILDDDLGRERFDVVTARHVLHHLVAQTAADTLALQRRAVARMLALVRPGGWLVFEEEVNRVKPFARAVYYLSRFASRHKLRWRYFEAGKVVVSFMTPSEVRFAVDAAGEHFPLRVVEEAYEPWQVHLRWKLTFLMAYVGNLLFVVKREHGPRAERGEAVSNGRCPERRTSYPSIGHRR